MDLFVPGDACLHRVRRRWVVPLLNLLITCIIVALAVWLAPEARASILVSPARFELEVSEDGSEEALTFVNRGDEAVWLRIYAGLGTQAANGAPLYFDDPESRLSASQWIHISDDQLRLEPGELRRILVQFAPFPGAVAAYPVLFAEILSSEIVSGVMREMSSEAASDGTGDRVPPERVHRVPQSVTRVAIPGLITFANTRSQRDLRVEIGDLRILPVAGTASVQLEVDVANAGNIHGRAGGAVHAFDEEGRLLATQVLPPIRVLPGAIRTLSLRWDARELPRIVRFVAEVDPGDEDGPPRQALSMMALTVAMSVSEGEVTITHEALERFPLPVNVARLPMLPERK